VVFNIFINSLFTDIKALDIGIDIEGEKNGILLYADDIVLIIKIIRVEYIRLFKPEITEFKRMGGRH
jgi:hypothetical protein